MNACTLSPHNTQAMAIPQFQIPTQLVPILIDAPHLLARPSPLAPRGVAGHGEGVGGAVSRVVPSGWIRASTRSCCVQWQGNRVTPNAAAGLALLCSVYFAQPTKGMTDQSENEIFARLCPAFTEELGMFHPPKL